MKRKSLLSAVLILILGMFSQISAQTDKQVNGIKKIYQETNEKIAECEANGEYSTTFLSEMVVNKNNGSYPAVGIYQSTVKFYYTYGDREKNPYPNTLLKVVVMTRRSSQNEYSEYLFNPAGQLIFYYEKNEENPNNELRFYFAAEKLIKSLKGEISTNISGREELTAAKTILSEKKKLIGIFQNSLE